jgi:hypothetical protein
MLKQSAAVQKEKEKLEKELGKIKDQNAQYLHTIDTLKEQVGILKAGNGDMNELDKKEFEKRINNYIKEIDRCIALLSE